MKHELNLYFAGELFSLKHLHGNALLADAIHRASEGRIKCLLPQAYEQRGVSACEIRDQDLAMVARCDIALFNYDGPDLDSGTVVEFMTAKFLDIPCVLLRTDFREAGDDALNPWNLMTSYYPRSETVIIDSMSEYQKVLKGKLQGLSAPTVMVEKSVRALEQVEDELAIKLIQAFDRAIKLPPVLSRDALETAYKNLPMIAGGTLAQLLPPKEIQRILDDKRAKGLIA